MINNDSIDQIIYDSQKDKVEANEKLYYLFSSKLYSVCLKYSRNNSEAEGNLQRGFISIFQKIKQYSFSISFEEWIKKEMIKTILTQYKIVRVLELTKVSFEDQQLVEVDLDSVPAGYLLTSIQQLPDRYRLVFNLYVMDNYSHEEIGQLLDISTEISKSNLWSARKILKEKIDLYKSKQQLTK